MTLYVTTFSKGWLRRKGWSVLNAKKKIGPCLGSSIRPNLVLIRPCVEHRRSKWLHHHHCQNGVGASPMATLIWSALRSDFNILEWQTCIVLSGGHGLESDAVWGLPMTVMLVHFSMTINHCKK